MFEEVYIQSNMAELSKQYRKHTHREHILSLPDTYIGSIENTTEELYIVNGESFTPDTVTNFNPGFYKLFDELLVNAHDHVVRLKQRKSANPVKNIDISVVDGTSIVIKNDGESIDVEKHPEYGVYIPQMIFGELLTSTNYDTTEKKLVGGKNGYGVKLVNIFAKKLTLNLVDGVRQLKYTQTFEDNMSVVGTPKIVACKNKPYVEVTWTPDFSRFGWKENKIPNQLLKVIERRVYDLAMTVGKDVKVTWCDNLIKFRDLSSYASWYLSKDAVVLTESPQTGWQIAVSDSPIDHGFNVSFVNGIWTRSGKHVDEITNQIVSYIVTYLETKKKIKVKPALVRDSLAVFICCSVENPSFSSQTKEVLTSKVSCKLEDTFLKKVVAKLEVVNKVLEAQDAKDAKDMKKTDGKKQSRLTGLPKLDDAVYAGTAKSHECVLILTEGDSAKAMAISGLSQEQRKYYGVFPLKGKLLNVKDISAKKVEATEEIANLKKIVGLESGKKYSDVRSLRYGKILIMTDQDYDGSHIRGLLINMFHELWHELIKIPGFITYMATPIVKANKGKLNKSFYTQYEYEEWRKTEASKGWKVKYYKGLGTSTRDEAKEYFKTLNIVNYTYSGDASDKSIDLAFNKAKADNRKDWLKSYDRADIVNAGPGDNLIYEDFVNKDLIHFSNYNLERSIPNVMDGLKTSQRKILYSAFKRNLKSEIRVAQFAGYVSEHSGYHHGEASLNDAIVGMAQDFVGSNNLAWLVPQGQFGTRLQGGKDSASPRYIHTYLHSHISQLVPSDDFDVLTYRDDDGVPVEPEWYAPVLPMLLVNGSRGIGTGYSTFVPSFNPSDLKSAIVEWLEKGSGLDREFAPWTRGFKGKITKIDRQDYLVEGVWKMDGDTATITELPIGTWTSDFRETLDKLCAEGTIKDYTDTSTDTDVLMKVKIGTGGVSTIEKLLTEKIKLTNMHAFDSKCVIKKYDSPNDILREFVGVRLDMYSRRREYMLKALRDKLPYHENVVRFINQQCEELPRPDLRRETAEKCDILLDKEKFDRIKGTFDYLMDLPIKSLTLKNAQKHENDLTELRQNIIQLESQTPKGMWLNELKKLTV
jgi:DNA topoisomerase-2